MRMKRKNIFMVLVLTLAVLGIGYAYLTTSLSINGTADVDSNTWNVYFDNVQVTTGSVTGDQVIQEPTISNNTTVNFHIRLKEPGEYYEFTIDAKNDGSIDAMIDEVIKRINGSTTPPAYLNYNVTYVSGSEIERKHILRSNTFARYKVRVEYKDDINPSSLPSTAQTIPLTINMLFIQKDSTGIRNIREVYSIDYNTFIGDQFLKEPYNPDQPYHYYNTMEELFSPDAHYPNTTYGNKIIAENDIVIGAEVLFKYNGTIYSIKGGGSTYNPETSEFNEDSIYYDENLNLITNLFGAENCWASSESTYNCQQNGGIFVYISKNGDVGANGAMPYACGVGPYLGKMTILCGG